MLLRGVAHEGVQALARDYESAPFIGRNAELAWLAGLRGGELGVLCAPAGRGKSALLLRLARRLDAAGELVAWAPISLRFGTHRSATVEDLLAARLRALLGGQGHPRERIAAHQGPPLWVIIDGLDELQDSSLLDALAGLTLPPSVRLLVAARTLLDRDAAGWASRLGIQPCALRELPPLSFDEVASFPALAPAPEVMRRTGGDPLLIRLCMEALDRGEPLPDVSDPAELVGAWWSDQRARLQAPQGELAARTLGALGAACGVVPWAVLAAALESDEGEARAALTPFARFVIEVPAGVTFAHPRFAEVARWTLPDEVQQAQRRFAALASRDRQSPDPAPYFLHFAAAHLAAAGAPDDAIHALVSYDSMEAWRRHEGGASGFLQDLRASWDRAERAVQSAWGTPAALEPLRQQSFCLALEEVVKAQEVSIDPHLRAALLSHGLRSVQATLASLDALDPDDSEDNRWSAVDALLPVLPDASLPALLAMSTPLCWPRDRVIEHLHARGLTRQALDHLLEHPQGQASSLLHLAPALTADEIRLASAAILQGDPDAHHLDHLLRLVPLLDPEPRQGLLARAEARWMRGQTSSDLSLGVSLSDAHARLGDHASALDWAQRMAALLTPDARYQHGWLRRLIETLSAMLPRCPDDLRSQTEELLDALARYETLGVENWALIQRARPHLEAPARLLQDIDDRPWIVWLAPHLPPALAARCEAALLRHLRESLADPHTTPIYALASALASSRPVTDRAAFLALVPAWIDPARGAHSLTDLARAIARLDHEDTHDAVCAHLQAVVERGAEPWLIPGWERFFSHDERRSLLAARLREPLKMPDPYGLCSRLEHLINRRLPGEAHDARERLRALARRPGHSGVHALTSVLKCLPPAERSGRVRALLPPGTEIPYHPFRDILPLLEDPDLRAELARRFFAQASARTSHQWPEVFFDALPVDEREPAERAFAARLEHDRLSFNQGSRLPAWLRAELAHELQGRDDAALLTHAGLIEDPTFEAPAQLRQALRDALSRALAAVPPWTGAHASESPCWRAVQNMARNLAADDLLQIGQFVDRAPPNVRVQIALRAWALLIEGGPEPLFSLLEACSQALPDDQPMQLRVGLWRHRALPPDERMAAAMAGIKGGGDAAGKLTAIHDLARLGLAAATARLLLRLTPARQHLSTLGWLWPHLSPAERQSFHTDLQHAAPHSHLLYPLEALCDHLTDDTARRSWRRELLAGGAWQMPVALLQRAGGLAALDAWARGAAEGFTPPALAARP